MEIKLILTRKVVHLVLFSKWGFLELERDLLERIICIGSHILKWLFWEVYEVKLFSMFTIFLLGILP